MIVLGGTYRESVISPDSDEVAGSGMRAAAALSNRPEGRPVLHTPLDAVGTNMRDEAELVAAALGVELASGVPDRDEPIGFRYPTPISTPAINGPSSRIQGEHVVRGGGETVLAFGLIEAPQVNVRDQPTVRVRIEAKTLVIDPQRPRDAEPLSLAGLDAESIYVVANAVEISKLGNASNVREAAAGVLERDRRIRGVVTKRGAAGCLVSTGSDDGVRHELVGAHPTRRVWPIGSGDVFSAGLAHAIDQGRSLMEAATVGSAAAAHWCSTRVHGVPPAILAGDSSGLPRAVSPSTPTIYLAGPFFTIAERWLVETVRDELQSLGARVWSPFHMVGPGGLEVAEKDLEGLLECDVVLALLDHADPGTVFEVGWAVRHEIPVVGYGLSMNPEGAKMMAGTAVELHEDLSSACYRAVWAGMGVRPQPGWVR